MLYLQGLASGTYLTSVTNWQITTQSENNKITIIELIKELKIYFLKTTTQLKWDNNFDERIGHKSLGIWNKTMRDYYIMHTATV